MSIPKAAYRWPSLVLEWSEATGSARLLLLVLAHYADEAGRCWPSLDTLALDTNLQRRQVIYLIQELEAMGELVRERTGRGRGNPSRYRLRVGAAKVHSTAPIAAGEKVQPAAPFGPQSTGREKVHSSVIKGALQRRKKVHSTAPERLERSEQAPRSTSRPPLGGAASGPAPTIEGSRKWSLTSRDGRCARCRRAIRYGQQFAWTSEDRPRHYHQQCVLGAVS